MTDPIADMLTVIRNGILVRREKVDTPHSKLKVSILEILRRSILLIIMKFLWMEIRKDYK